MAEHYNLNTPSAQSPEDKEATIEDVSADLQPIWGNPIWGGNSSVHCEVLEIPNFEASTLDQLLEIADGLPEDTSTSPTNLFEDFLFVPVEMMETEFSTVETEANTTETEANTAETEVNTVETEADNVETTPDTLHQDSPEGLGVDVEELLFDSGNNSNSSSGAGFDLFMSAIDKLWDEKYADDLQDQKNLSSPTPDRQETFNPSGVFADALFKDHENEIAFAMLHSLCHIVPDENHMARFACLLCPKSNNLTGFDAKKHIREHHPLLRCPKTFSGLSKNLLNLSYRRKTLTNSPKKLFCGVCFKFLNSNIEYYIHFVKFHSSMDEMYKICPECFLPLFNDTPQKHFRYKHSKICSFFDCSERISSLKQLIDHSYSNHFNDIFPPLANFQDFYSLTATNSPKCFWTPDIKITSFLKSDQINNRVPSFNSPRFFYELEQLSKMKNLFLCNVDINLPSVKTSHWESLPFDKVMHRDCKIIDLISEFFSNLWESNSLKINDIFQHEVISDPQIIISCNTCYDNNDHSQSRKFCIPVDKFLTEAKTSKSALEKLLSTNIRDVAGVWICNINGPLGRGPMSSKLPILNLSYDSTCPMIPLTIRHGKSLSKSDGRVMYRFFNLQIYLEKIYLTLPKHFFCPVFIEFFYSGSLDDTIEMANYCIAFISMIAELRNKYHHNTIILGPCPRKIFSQNDGTEFEYQRTNLHHLTNILSLVAYHANIPVFPLIGSVVALEKENNKFVFWPNSVCKENHLFNYSGTVTREFVHRLSSLVDSCHEMVAKAIITSNYRRTYETLMRSPNREKYFPLVESI